jgi:hypothetical protein
MKKKVQDGNKSLGEILFSQRYDTPAPHSIIEQGAGVLLN